MPKYRVLLCLAALSFGLAGCGKSGETKDIGDKKTREAESKTKLMDAFNNDPNYKARSSTSNAGPSPHMAPPGYSTGGAH